MVYETFHKNHTSDYPVIFLWMVTHDTSHIDLETIKFYKEIVFYFIAFQLTLPT